MQSESGPRLLTSNIVGIFLFSLFTAAEIMDGRGQTSERAGLDLDLVLQRSSLSFILLYDS